MPHLQTQDTPSNREYIFMMITSFYLIICHSRKCFQPSIYVAYQIENTINTTIIRLLQNFHCYYYGYCRLMADGMRIFHMECRYCFITVLDRGPRPSHPWYSLFTPHFSTHQQVTHYASSLMKHCLDVLS